MNNIEKNFNQFLQCVNYLQEALNVSFAEALTETFDNLENNTIKVELGAPDQEQVQELSKLYQGLNYDELSDELKAEIFTLLSVKAINDDERDANQMPTPPNVATVIAMLMEKLLPQKAELSLMDPCIGTGNMFLSVVRQLVKANHSKNNFKLSGIDNDEDMLSLADVAAHLMHLPIDLYRQDALEPWMVAKQAAIVSDLPVGYYPIDEIAQKYATRAEKGHSYAHYLLTEQIINNLEPGGLAFLVVPKSMIEGAQAQDFMTWLTKKVYLRAVVGLPSDMFQNKFNQKEILVFQNHGASSSRQPVLAAKLDSFRSKESLLKFNVKLNEWYTEIDH